MAYDPDNSTASIRRDSEPFEEKYGSADLLGYNYTDLVCLNPINNGSYAGKPCLKDFNFMAIS